MALTYVACSGPHWLGCRQSLTKTYPKSQVLSKGWVASQQWPRLFSLVLRPVHFRVYNCQLLGEQDRSSTSLPAVVIIYPHRKCPLCLRLNLLWPLSSVPRTKFLCSLYYLSKSLPHPGASSPAFDSAEIQSFSCLDSIETL